VPTPVPTPVPTVAPPPLPTPKISCSDDGVSYTCTWQNESNYSKPYTASWIVNGGNQGSSWPTDGRFEVGKGSWAVYLHLEAPGYAPVNSAVQKLK
jgi:hypothetical protein